SIPTLTYNELEHGEGDGVRVRGEEALSFTQGRDAEVLVFDLRDIETSALWA
ncbi:MAG: quercetin 2,3-dioxygenase, partial [Paraburkholderia graminis]